MTEYILLKYAIIFKKYNLNLTQIIIIIIVQNENYAIGRIN